MNTFVGFITTGEDDSLFKKKTEKYCLFKF